MRQIDQADQTVSPATRKTPTQSGPSAANGAVEARLAGLVAQVESLTARVAELDDRVAELVDQGTHFARGWRFASAITFLGILALTYVAGLSDLAPILLRRIEDRMGILGSVPFSIETMLHFTGWALAMIFAGIAVRSLPSLIWVAIGLSALGVGVEVLQDHFTATRQQEWGDVIANSTGLSVGLLVILAVRAGVYLTDPRRSRHNLSA